ncbi:MAG: hypothetical protein OXE47_09280, partial [Gammaproteobacteria bacterium]|nr:hypothetical protein [Gammaproteobacteria bacterium]
MADIIATLERFRGRVVIPQGVSFAQVREFMTDLEGEEPIESRQVGHYLRARDEGLLTVVDNNNDNDAMTTRPDTIFCPAPVCQGQPVGVNTFDDSVFDPGETTLVILPPLITLSSDVGTSASVDTLVTMTAAVEDNAVTRFTQTWTYIEPTAQGLKDTILNFENPTPVADDGLSVKWTLSGIPGGRTFQFDRESTYVIEGVQHRLTASARFAIIVTSDLINPDTVMRINAGDDVSLREGTVNADTGALVRGTGSFSGTVTCTAADDPCAFLVGQWGQFSSAAATAFPISEGQHALDFSTTYLPLDSDGGVGDLTAITYTVTFDLPDVPTSRDFFFCLQGVALSGQHEVSGIDCKTVTVTDVQPPQVTVTLSSQLAGSLVEGNNGFLINSAVVDQQEVGLSYRWEQIEPAAAPGTANSIFSAPDRALDSSTLLVDRFPAIIPDGQRRDFRVRLTVTDSQGNAGQNTVTMNVADSTPPELLSAEAIGAELTRVTFDRPMMGTFRAADFAAQNGAQGDSTFIVCYGGVSTSPTGAGSAALNLSATTAVSTIYLHGADDRCLGNRGVSSYQWSIWAEGTSHQLFYTGAATDLNRNRITHGSVSALTGRITATATPLLDRLAPIPWRINYSSNRARANHPSDRRSRVTTGDTVTVNMVFAPPDTFYCGNRALSLNPFVMAPLGSNNEPIFLRGGEVRWHAGQSAPTALSIPDISCASPDLTVTYTVPAGLADGTVIDPRFSVSDVRNNTGEVHYTDPGLHPSTFSQCVKALPTTDARPGRDCQTIEGMARLLSVVDNTPPAFAMATHDSATTTTVIFTDQDDIRFASGTVDERIARWTLEDGDGNAYAVTTVIPGEAARSVQLTHATVPNTRSGGLLVSYGHHDDLAATRSPGGVVDLLPHEAAEFTDQAVSDRRGPSLLSATPGLAADTNLRTYTLALAFDEGMKGGTLTVTGDSPTVIVHGQRFGRDVPLTGLSILHANGDAEATVVFPAGNLGPAQGTYTVIVTTGAQDDDGNPVAAEITRTFDLTSRIMNLSRTAPTGAISEADRLTYTVILTEASAGQISASWTVRGSALAFTDIDVSPADFVGGAFPFGTVTFAPGETSQTITIMPLVDSAAEGAEGFDVVLSSLNDPRQGTQFPRGSNIATVTESMADGGATGSIGFTGPTDRQEQTEGGSPFVFPLQLDSTGNPAFTPAPLNVHVAWTVTGGGLSAADFTTANPLVLTGVTNAAAVTNHEFRLTPVDDNDNEMPRDFTVHLAGVTLTLPTGVALTASRIGVNAAAASRDGRLLDNDATFRMPTVTAAVSVAGSPATTTVEGVLAQNSRNIATPTVVTLTGSVTRDPGDADSVITVAWQQIASDAADAAAVEPPTVVLNTPSALVTTFNAPNVAVSETLHFRFSVTTAKPGFQTITQQERVSITVTDVQPPFVNADLSFATEENNRIYFYGAYVEDDGDTPTLLWTQDPPTPAARFADATRLQPGGNWPDLPNPGTELRLRMTLTATDAGGRTGSDSITVTIRDGSPPTVALAQTALTVQTWQEFTLDGSGSRDARGGDNTSQLTYTWQQATSAADTFAGQAEPADAWFRAVRGSRTASTVTATAPATPGVYYIRLRVGDRITARLVSAVVTLTVTERAPPTVTATVPATQSINEGDIGRVPLTATVTFPDGTPQGAIDGAAFEYVWEELAGAAADAAVIAPGEVGWLGPFELTAGGPSAQTRDLFFYVAGDAEYFFRFSVTATLPGYTGPSSATARHTLTIVDTTRPEVSVPSLGVFTGQVNIELDATVSIDPGATGTTTYQWTQTGGTPTLTVTGADTEDLTITTLPAVDAGMSEVFQFQLMVTDSNNRSRSATGFVTVFGLNPPTAAFAENPIDVTTGAAVTLSGAPSVGVTGSTRLAFRFAQVDAAGNPVTGGPTLTHAGSPIDTIPSSVGVANAIASFTAPSTAATLYYDMTVTDPFVYANAQTPSTASSTARVTVNVAPPPAAAP